MHDRILYIGNYKKNENICIFKVFIIINGLMSVPFFDIAYNYYDIYKYI